MSHGVYAVGLRRTVDDHEQKTGIWVKDLQAQVSQR